MQQQPVAIGFLVAEDDPDDRLLIKEAFEELRLANPVAFAEDGVELMEYLRREDQALPGLVLLDLNMPRKDGREAIAEIKADEDLKHLPVVVLTTSDAETDICRTYKLGANSYIRKPVSFDGLIEVIKVLNEYWLQIVTLPAK